ncbi:MAG: aspS [Candidatus Saccharibacteria bacterium]|nr:aspS [Candidatus Saccharibacteria bacterium]
MERTYTTDAVEQIGKTITVKGWVNARRDHGGVIFIDVRDYKGVLQLTIHPQAEAAFQIGQDLRDEFVIKATGEIKEREEGLKNPNLETGAIELVVSELTILNKSEALPIQVNSAQFINEESRLKYRYLDLRRPKMQMMLKKRAEMYSRIRKYMDEREFIEIQTPILANSSPEGARDFLIPARMHPGSFYALPQAPQQFKQLLMVGGVPRYYQMAACFRDEDPRADRLYGEFYQLDMEMSFVEDGEEVRTTIEPLIVDLVKGFAGKKLLEEKIPRIPYSESMERFGIDKPDLRYGMELVELSDEVKDAGFSVFANAVKDGGCVKAITVKGASELSRSQIDNFTEIAKREGAGGLAYITVKDGEAVSPIAKFFTPEELKTIITKMEATDGDVIFFGADKREVVNKVLGKLRIEFANHFKLKDPNIVALCWIVDFPFYEYDEQNKKLDFGHNPFSMPKGGLEALKAEDKLGILADQYDMVMNGYEICSGGVRNHNPDVLYEVFGVLGYDKAYVESKFGAMLSAFKYGAPPHAGCAYGLDRMFMELMSEDNVREVVAFPKNGSGVDLMTGSPSAAEPKLIKELGIKIVEG